MAPKTDTKNSKNQMAPEADISNLKSQIREALDALGYEVMEGVAGLFDDTIAPRIVDAFGNCFGNNPATPYVVPLVPHRSEEFYSYGHCMHWDETNDFYATYRLREDEAILMFGNMPPKGAYLGFETFLFGRHFNGADPSSMEWLTDGIGLQRHLSPHEDNILYSKMPNATDGDKAYEPDPNRALHFANLGPTINRAVLENDFDPNFWEQQMILSTSADADFKAALNAELAKAGVNPQCHFHLGLGAELDMGLAEESDDFWTLMRYAVPTDTAAGEQWRKDVANQLGVFRVAKKTKPAVRRHPTPVFPEKTAISELQQAPELQQVANEVGTFLQFNEASQQVFLSLSNIPLHGPVTVSRAMNCIGATYDTDTYRLTTEQILGENAIFAVVGSNHTETQNASYISLGFYDSTILMGFDCVSQGSEVAGRLTGSVEKFFSLFGATPESLNNIELSKYYVHILVRDSSKLPEELQSDTNLYSVIATSDLAIDRPLRVSQRAYLNQNSICGADATKTLSPILLTHGGVAKAKKSDS